MKAKLIFKGKNEYGFERNFNVSDLEDLYIKVNKQTQVYTPLLDVWQGWTYGAGETVGKLYSFVSEWDEPLDGMTWEAFKIQRRAIYGSYPSPKGLWLVFKTVQGTSYYIKYEKGLIDWNNINIQLTAARRAKMGWFGKYFDELENAIVAKLQATAQAAKEGLAIGAGIGLTILAIYGIFKKVQHDKTIEEYKAIAREVGKGSK